MKNYLKLFRSIVDYYKKNKITLTYFRILISRLFHIKYKNRILIAGPYVGEFGWELMEWQGYVRRLRCYYNNVIVISFKNREYLYEDCQFHSHNFELEKSGTAFGQIKISEFKNIIGEVVTKNRIKKYDIFLPFDLNKLSKLIIGKQKHKKFYHPTIKDKKYTIVFHFRHFKRNDADNKNMSNEDADKLSEYFSRKGYDVCAIGHPSLSYCPNIIDDCRTEKLEQTVSIISNSNIVVGGSSAPMHLAQLCGKPIVTWIADADVERYLSYWNPFKVPAFIVSKNTFQPKTDNIIKKIERAINK